MKSKVDIFRPLLGCRSDSTTSIFRRNNNNNQKEIHRGTDSKISKDNNAAAESDDEESIVVVSTPPGEWPPHKNTLSSTASSEITNSPHKHLKTSAPLPFSADSTDSATTTKSSSHDDGNCCTSPSPQTSTATTATTTTQVATPSYYRIELDPENDNMVQLTAGDDSSVQFTPEVHNRQLQMAIQDDRNKGIIRASPVVERKELAIEIQCKEDPNSQQQHHHRMHQQQQQQPQQRWTISDNGKIIAMPPSPSDVSMTHDYVPKRAQGSVDDDLSLPPMLVKANSHGDSSSQSSNENDDDNDDDNVSYLSSNSHQNDQKLESPPRMTRSIISQSLFQDSIGSSSREGSQGSRSCSRTRKSMTGVSSDGDDAKKHHAGSCGGTRLLPSFDFFGTLLDVFSLNGACCHQAKCGGAGACASSDTIVCR